METINKINNKNCRLVVRVKNLKNERGRGFIRIYARKARNRSEEPQVVENNTTNANDTPEVVETDTGTTPEELVIEEAFQVQSEFAALERQMKSDIEELEKREATYNPAYKCALVVLNSSNKIQIGTGFNLESTLIKFLNLDYGFVKYFTQKYSDCQIEIVHTYSGIGLSNHKIKKRRSIIVLIGFVYISSVPFKKKDVTNFLDFYLEKDKFRTITPRYSFVPLVNARTKFFNAEDNYNLCPAVKRIFEASQQPFEYQEKYPFNTPVYTIVRKRIVLATMRIHKIFLIRQGDDLKGRVKCIAHTIREIVNLAKWLES